MICGGDEIGRTQQGNNNAYCQDNETSWLHWDLTPEQQDLLEFTQYLTQFVKNQPVLTRRKFFLGRSIRGVDVKDISWFGPDGKEMSDRAWMDHFVRCLGVRLSGSEIGELDEYGNPMVGDTLFLMFNAHYESIPFVLPKHSLKESWIRVLDTAESEWNRPSLLGDHAYKLRSRSLAVFRLQHQATRAAKLRPRHR